MDEIRIVNLKNRIKEIACEETAHPLFKEKWSEANPMLGHCAIVSALFYNKFGGEILKGIIAETGMSHYWNKLNGKEYDLTREQFSVTPTLVEIETVSVERILSNENTKQRFDLLLQKLNELPEYANDH